MSADFDKLREIFLAALEQAPDQRDTYLTSFAEVTRNCAATWP